LIAFALVFRFDQDDHFTFFNVVTHVKIGTYPSQVTLWDTRVMLFELIRSHVLPFESFVVLYYFQMQFFLMDQLHEQKFNLLLTNVTLDVV
jgi:hypothetical protein